MQRTEEIVWLTEMLLEMIRKGAEESCWSRQDNSTATVLIPRRFIRDTAVPTIYGEEGEGNGNGGTFGARVFLCLLLFAAFVTMDMKKQEVFHVDSERIVKEITTDMDVAEVWKNL